MSTFKSFFAITMACLVCLLAVGVTAQAAGGQAQRVHVINAGIGGQNSLQGRERFMHDVVEAHPRYVLIYFGMNDTANEPRFLSQKQYIHNINWMASCARKNHTVPIVSTVQHVDVERWMGHLRRSEIWKMQL